MIRTLSAQSQAYDALVFPTTPNLPPPISLFGDHQSMDEYTRINGLSLRNTYVGNAFDRCSISIPCHEPGAAPVGFMLVGEHGADRLLFAVAAAIEGLLDRNVRRKD